MGRDLAAASGELGGAAVQEHLTPEWCRPKVDMEGCRASSTSAATELDRILRTRCSLTSGPGHAADRGAKRKAPVEAIRF